MADDPVEFNREIQFYYAGPRFPFGMLRNTVYLGGIPAQAMQFIDQIPALAELFVPINPAEGRVARARAEVRTPGTKLYALATEVRAWIQAEQKRRHARPAGPAMNFGEGGTQ